MIARYIRTHKIRNARFHAPLVANPSLSRYAISAQSRENRNQTEETSGIGGRVTPCSHLPRINSKKWRVAYLPKWASGHGVQAICVTSPRVPLPNSTVCRAPRAAFHRLKLKHKKCAPPRPSCVYMRDRCALVLVKTWGRFYIWITYSPLTPVPNAIYRIRTYSRGQ